MIIKTIIVVNFQVTKFSFIDFVLTDRRSLSGKRPKSASGKSSNCRFSFSAERNANTKATEYVTFGFSLSIMVFFPLLRKFEPHCLSTIRNFSRFSSDKKLVFRIVKALPFIHQPDRVVPKASDVSAADWLYHHT